MFSLPVSHRLPGAGLPAAVGWGWAGGAWPLPAQPGLKFAGAALEHGSRSGDDHRAAVNAFGVSAGRRREVWRTEPTPFNKLCTSVSAHPPLPDTNSVC